jgi:hypothetical protein
MLGLQGSAEHPWVVFVDQPLGFRGEILTSGLMELVQVIAITSPTCALQVEVALGTGTIWFENGAIVHAVSDNERGAAAFQRMLHWPCGRFTVERGAQAPERSIDASTTQLLLESTRILDEQKANAEAEFETSRAAE